MRIVMCRPARTFAMLAAAAALTTASGCGKQAVAPVHIVRPVVVATAVQRDMPIYIESFGTLDPYENIDLKAEVSGKVIAFCFKEGQLVQKGDLLFVIDTNQYVAALEKAQASLEQSKVNLKRTHDTYERNRKLVDQKVISPDEFEQFATDYEGAQAACKLAQAQVRLADLDLDHCTIESPVTGYTGARLIDPGNIVPANTGPTLVNIKRVDLLRLDFTIPEKFFFRARAACASNTVYALLTPQGVDTIVATGIVDFINNSVDDQTGTIALRASVPNDALKLWAGQFVTIKFIIGMQKNAVLVPYVAVQNGQQGHYLFVVTPDKKADLRIVSPSLRHGDLLALDSGVKPGETVVTIGQMGLAPGVDVAVITSNAAPAAAAAPVQHK